MFSQAHKVKVVFCWHMHQPDYRDRLTGEYYFPWTYLHALKDYTDMAAHLEHSSGARAVVNFAPILLEQLDDYENQLQAYLKQGKPIKDPALAVLVREDLPAAGSQEFETQVKNCLRANRNRMIDRFAPYAYLVRLWELVQEHPQGASYLSPQFLIDLVVWYHLSWLGECARRTDSRIKSLQDKGNNFSDQDRRALLGIITEQLASIKPRYRKLQEQGRIELTMSPYAHPILPLLLDLNSTHEAMPQAPLPKADSYPGGPERAAWHLKKGLAVFEDYFGCRPSGCWASEGALSDACFDLLEQTGFQWAATGDSVLHNSLTHAENEGRRPEQLHRAFAFEGKTVCCFFRDDGLSDLIGFQYADWHAEDAVGDLINHLTNIARTSDNPKDCVISIIMDGENAWEYYPENAWYFLEALYRRLGHHPDFELTTYSELLALNKNKNKNKVVPVTLKHLVAGSWVYGTFSTWIGDADKNKAWDLLCAAKEAYDQFAPKLKPKERKEAELQLAQCEGSDWFWWFGDYNPSEAVEDFDYLYRRHLMNLYRLLKQPIPDNLHQAISKGGGNPAAGGVMRRGHAEESA